MTNFTVSPTTTLRPQQLSGYDLSTIEAVLIEDGTQQTAGVIPTVAGELLQSHYTFRISLAASIEAEEDVPDFASRIARAYGVAMGRALDYYSVNGSGYPTQPMGILNVLPAPLATYSVSAGTLDYEALNNIFYSVNKVHRDSPKAGWLMSDSVMKAIRNLPGATANAPLFSMQFDGFPGAVPGEPRPVPTILGRRAYISNQVPGTLNSNISASIAAQNSTLIFGDLGHFHIRCSKPTLQRSIESSIKGIEYGESLWIGRIRMDSNIFDPSSGGTPPIVCATVTP